MLRVLGLSVLGGLALGAILSFSGGRVTLREFGRTSFVSFTYALLIGGLATTAFFGLRVRLRALGPFAVWTAVLGVVLVCAVVGTLAGGLVLIALGWSTPERFWGVFQNGVGIALVVAGLTSVGALAYAKLREQAGHSARLAAEARLSSLESRIRPHFLFNALNAVLALIPEDPARAENVLERLTALLRFSLDVNPAGVVPLRDEMRIVRDYLEIERTRFGARLRFDIDVPAELDPVELPAFAVQTLVENSVKHAVSPRPEGGAIHVSATRAGGALRLEVSDDGPGFTGAAVVAGHGLDLLRERLATLYGAAGSLTILPPSRVVLAVPAGRP
jgi:signal transduction histidine kinase